MNGDISDVGDCVPWVGEPHPGSVVPLYLDCGNVGSLCVLNRTHPAVLKIQLDDCDFEPEWIVGVFEKSYAVQWGPGCVVLPFQDVFGSTAVRCRKAWARFEQLQKLARLCEKCFSLVKVATRDGNGKFSGPGYALLNNCFEDRLTMK